MFTGSQYLNQEREVPIWAQNNPYVNFDAIPQPKPEIGAGGGTWQEYLDNAYKNGLPSRLNQLNNAIQGGNISEHMVNRAIWEDAMWGGPRQDIPPELLRSADGIYPNGVMAYAGGPGSGNEQRRLEQILGSDIYQAPTMTNTSGGYGGLFDHAQETIDRSNAQGVPSAAARQAANFSAGITQAAIDDGDLATNTGLGPFAGLLTLASFIPGAQGLAPLAGIANATANQDIFGGITSIAGFGGNPLNVLGGQNAQNDWLDILQGSHTAAGGFRDIFSSGEAQQDDSGNDGENETTIPIPIPTGAPSSTNTQTTSTPGSVQVNRTGLLHNPGRYDSTYQPMRTGINYFDLNTPMVNPMLLGDLYA